MQVQTPESPSAAGASHLPLSPLQIPQKISETFKSGIQSLSPRRLRAVKKHLVPQQQVKASVESLVAPGTAQDRAVPLSEIAAHLDTAEGASASAIGSLVRTSGALRIVLQLVSHPDRKIHCMALYVLGNLSSDAVYPQSWRTKASVKELKGFERVLPYVWCDNEDTLFNALGAMQNLCSFVEYTQLMEDQGIDLRLQEIADRTEDAQLAEYALGCLRNIAAVKTNTSRVVRERELVEWPDLIDEGDGGGEEVSRRESTGSVGSALGC